ncbi:MAG: hypothetical protein J0I34_27375 [Pseudonocardia sp.]|uniref:hypothetical protein n=1 Tax=unclassified Pseudonocardia TaxID=2619320 RepID=UPI00086A2372|nr:MULTISPECIES: hypothetical protein [unclassified Pseudonocardia]MBN9112496.1 hypothetical protein [Pseudonocardia sp.]ODU03762.1 MAG: hypothetical protein ABS80_26435 [Pseudonocardia sp. SCN 72-51]ODV07105.1 MAG: hypothetical protein ABT15_10135 [Pseudonocardia sp. SCN 73-27]
MTVLVVDGANVVGSRPDGWWRDRAGAAARLASRLATALAAGPSSTADVAASVDRVVLVLEGAARAASIEPVDGLEVVTAAGDGDSTIVDVVAELTGSGAEVVVVTADRLLRTRVEAVGAGTAGPGTLLRALDTL